MKINGSVKVGKDFSSNYRLLNKLCCLHYGFISWFFMKKTAKKVLLEDCVAFVSEIIIPIKEKL